MFYITLKEFFGNPLGIPFSRYIEFTDDEVPTVKVLAFFPLTL